MIVRISTTPLYVMVNVRISTPPLEVIYAHVLFRITTRRPKHVSQPRPKTHCRTTKLATASNLKPWVMELKILICLSRAAYQIRQNTSSRSKSRLHWSLNEGHIHSDDWNVEYYVVKSNQIARMIIISLCIKYHPECNLTSNLISSGNSQASLRILFLSE